MSVRIYAMTHRPFEVPADQTYRPLHVGRKPWCRKYDLNLRKYRGMCTGEAGLEPAEWNAAAVDFPQLMESGELELLRYPGDDTGDSISMRNCYYSELTGLYWVWKNVSDVDIVGTCHYRRYLLDSQGYVFSTQEVEEILKSYDFITTKTLQLNYSYYEGFSENHKIYYLDETAKVIKDCYPEYYELFEKLVHEKHTYFGNMMICKKPLYDEYMEWLFGILFELEKRITIEEEDDYHRRIFGFISEFLQYVWVLKNRLKVYECKVGMLGEKVETAELKRKLASYFEDGDYESAKNYFMAFREKRPDVLMEASDITGELHLCMQVIVTAGFEQERYGTNLLNRMRGYEELMQFCNTLNRYTIGKLHGEKDLELERWVIENHVTEVAQYVSQAMFENNGQLKVMK